MLAKLKNRLRAFAKQQPSPDPYPPRGRINLEGRTHFSFIVDEHPRFAYEGYHLARSLLEHCGADSREIHVQFTPQVNPATRKLFADQGNSLHELERFGDGRYCNKVAQLANLHTCDFGRIVLLDTDAIVVSDLRPFLRDDVLMATVVNLPNPPLAALEEIARSAGMQELPPVIAVDSADGKTYLGNCNGGLYVIPKALTQPVDQEWRRWSTWLLENIGPLQRVGKQVHIDQVAMWLAIHMGKIPFLTSPSNINYQVHLTSKSRLDSKLEIAMIHYHDMCLNELGLIKPKRRMNKFEAAAVGKANAQIGRGFDTQTFWNLRYSQFSARGSGVGSRGTTLLYKRQLLINEGAELAGGILDVGCGDLEVLKVLNLHGYLGIDASESAIQAAKRARQDWEFRLLSLENYNGDIPTTEFVLCFEVLIHQNSRALYEKVIDFLVQHTERTLIVSGYERGPAHRRSNSMVFFYEPLEDSLRRTGRFQSIRKIGEHTDVSIYRCDVWGCSRNQLAA